MVQGNHRVQKSERSKPKQDQSDEVGHGKDRTCCWLVFKIKRATSQGIQAASRTQKGKEMASPLEGPKRTRALLTP